MIEVIAAIAGASISVAAMGAMGFGKRNDEARDAVIRLDLRGGAHRLAARGNAR
jgi:hypothetical protein